MGTQPAHVLLCTQSVSSPDHLQYPVQGSEVHCAVYRVTRRKTCPSMFSGMQFLFACIVCFLYIFNWHRCRRPSLIGCDLKSSPCGLGSNDLKASESEKTFCSLHAAPPPSPCLHHPFLYLHCRIFCFSTWSTQPEDIETSPSPRKLRSGGCLCFHQTSSGSRVRTWRFSLQRAGLCVLSMAYTVLHGSQYPTFCTVSLTAWDMKALGDYNEWLSS